MSFDVHSEKMLQANPQKVFETALNVVEKFQGKLVSKDAAKGRLEAKFPKTVLGKTLGDRCQVAFQINPAGEGGCQVLADGYPLDAIERKLMFGARAGVTATVITWFFAHLEHDLG